MAGGTASRGDGCQPQRRTGQEALPRHVRLLRRDIDLHHRHPEFADLRQGLHGLEEPLMGRIDPLLHRLLIASALSRRSAVSIFPRMSCPPTCRHKPIA